MGALPNVLPGHMLMDDEVAHQHIGAIWDRKLSDGQGDSGPEMIHQIAERKIRALYIVGENLVMSESQSP